LRSGDATNSTTTSTSTSPTAGVGDKEGSGVAVGNDGKNYGVKVGRSGGGV
jgi:hypothetical protein